MAALTRLRSGQVPRPSRVTILRPEPFVVSEAKLHPAGRLLIGLSSGVGLALAFPSHRVPLLAWISVTGLMWASLGVRLQLAALAGFLHGAAFYTITLPWVYTVMRAHGGLKPAAAAGVMALLVAVASMFPAAFALAVATVGRGSVTRACLAAPFLWVALEYARAHMPAIGFPWNLLGYAVGGNLPLLQLAAVTGIYGLSFLIAAFNALLAWGVTQREPGWRLAVLGILLFVAAALVMAAHYGEAWVPHPRAQHVARLVQTNFSQPPSYPADWMELHSAELDELERLSVAVSDPRTDLVIWPEVPAPFSLQEANFAARAARIARTSRRPFLVGVVVWEPGRQGGLAPYNSAALLDPEGRLVFRYDKIHLVPFGEYVPLRRWLSFAGKLTAEVGDFQPGLEYRLGSLPAGTSAGGAKFGVIICYEAIFPDEVRHFVANGAGLLINLSNDGWFGRSAAPEQHLAMARVRAVENRRWLLRATNNGYTVAVDPYGRYAARLTPDVRGALDAPYGFRNDVTFYVRWGDWLAWLCVAVGVGYVVVGARNAGAMNKPGKR